MSGAFLIEYEPVVQFRNRNDYKLIVDVGVRVFDLGHDLAVDPHDFEDLLPLFRPLHE